MITLTQFPRSNGINPSPFCFKLESYLRAMRIEHTIAESVNPKKSPTHKIPYVTEGSYSYSDSGIIIKYYENTLKNNMQHSLSDSEKSMNVAYTKLIEEHLYRCLVYSRWIDSQGFPMFKEKLTSNISAPKFIANIIINMIRKDVSKQLNGHGLGRHKQDTIYKMANEDIKSLSDFLADRKFCFQDKPTLLDHTIFSISSCILSVSWDTPLKIEMLKYTNLVEHCKLMNKIFFSDIILDI